jgi:PAS domain S-box-containing protein
MSRLGHGWSETLDAALLGAAFDALPYATAAIATPAEPVVAHANEAFCRLVGRQLNELAMHPLWDVTLLATPADQRRLLSALRRGRAAKWARVPVLHRDGSRRVVELRLAFVHDDGPSWAVLTALETEGSPDDRDIVAFNEFLEVAPGAILGIEPDGRIAMANAEAEGMFGYARAELIGQPVDVLVPRWLRAARAPFQTEYFRDPRPRRSGLTQYGRRRDGSEFPVEVRLSTLETTRAPIALASIRDISGRLSEETAIRDQEHRRQILSALLGVEEAERSRIATSLHDDTVQVLTASLLALDRLARAARKDPRLADTAEEVQRTRAVLSQATDRTRRLTFELRPTVLHERGIAPAVRALAESLRHETSIETELDVTEGRFDWAVEELAFRTIQEAVANVRKHAQAKRVTIAVHTVNSHMVGEVTDDGRGFDLERATDREQMALHQGLDAMSERVRMTGGQITIESAPGEGTRVRFELPTFR